MAQPGSRRIKKSGNAGKNLKKKKDCVKTKETEDFIH
jgi:hypothetical protein